MILLRFDIEQVVDGNRKVVATHVVVADGDGDVFLLLGRVAQQLLHAVAQVPVVVDDDGQRGNDNPDNHRPIQESEEEPNRDGVLEYKREQDEIADGNKQNQPEHRQRLMPDTPGLYVCMERAQGHPAIDGIAPRRDQPE